MSAKHAYAFGAMTYETASAANSIRRYAEVIDKHPDIARQLLLELADRMDGAKDRCLAIGNELLAKQEEAA